VVEYLWVFHHVGFFLLGRSADSMIQAAKAKNLDGAALA